MDIIKQCLYCSEPLINKRSDAKFCSSTCKAKYNKEHDHEPEGTRDNFSQPGKNPKLSDTLNGTFTENQPDNSKADEADWEAYNRCKRQIDVYKTSIWRMIGQRNAISDQVKAVQNNTGMQWIYGSALFGAFIGSKTNQDHTILFGLAGTGLGIIFKNLSEPAREEAKAKVLALLKQKDGRLAIEVKRQFDQYSALRQQLPALLPQLQLVSNKPADESNPIISDTPNPDFEQENDSEENPRIISSETLKQYHYKALSFQGEWLTLFGCPSINFHCAIHGLPGEGKSTFAIQFAKYLADSFGKVIYISGEEGFSKTFKDKFSNNQAFSPNLYTGDLKSFEDILEYVPVDTYHFVVIDSLDNMRIDAQKMKQLREHYRQSAIITISQSTKDGKMRGSLEIVHDADIAVNVSDGIAKTTKNRFKAKGMTFDVFKTKDPTFIKDPNKIF